MPLAPPSLFLKLIGLTSARSLGVRHTSFSAQPPDLPSWFYVCLLGFGLCCNLTRHLALYQVSVRRLVRLATPLLPSQPRGFRLAVHYTWRQIPVTGLSPARCASCPTHNKKNGRSRFLNTQNWTGSTPFNKATLGSITKVIKGSSEPSWRF